MNSINTLYKFKALGGLSEIGANTSLLTLDGEHFLIDCGISFPKTPHSGANYYIPQIPDVTIKGLFVTHGHEDHIGAIPHLVKKMPMLTIWTTRFTKKLIEEKLAYNHINFDRFIIFDRGETQITKNWSLEPLSLYHSIPEARGLLFRTDDRKHSLLFATDLRIKRDHSFLDTLRKMECQSRSLFIDSTNVLQEESSLFEEDLHKGFTDLMMRDEKRIFITLFASNIERVNKIVTAALASGRSVHCIGNSLMHYMRVAEDSHLIDFSLDQIKESISDEGKALILLSGCQGDLRSALRRVAYGESSEVKISASDLMVFSSKAIPGNEIQLSQIYNKFAEIGVKILLPSKNSPFHASGHPSQSELRHLYEAYRPTHAIPVHGEVYFLREHISFIKENKFAEPIFLVNEEELQFRSDSTFEIFTPKEKTKFLAVLSSGIEVDSQLISDRLKTSRRGAIFISITKASEEFTLMGLPLPSEFQFEEYFFKKSRELREGKLTAEEYRVRIRKWWTRYVGEKPQLYIHDLREKC